MYLSDTKWFPGLVGICRNADLLICESTYSQADERLAAEHGHMTSVDAARLALESQAKRLVLTHISQRSSPEQIEAEARPYFAQVEVAEDFLRLSVS